MSALLAIADEMGRLAYKLRHVPHTAILEEACGIVGDRTRNNFIRGEAPDGTKWAARKDNKGHPLLILSGLLMTQALSACASPRISGHNALISVPEPDYGIFHITGTKNMPARPWLGVSDEDVQEMADLGGETALEFILRG